MAPVTSTPARTVEVRYFAAAKAAAGRAAESVELPATASIDDLAERLAERHGPDLRKVLARCSYLVDEVAVRDHSRALVGEVVDVLPPFAGG
jgi:molybdopterin converting factor small subunit